MVRLKLEKHKHIKMNRLRYKSLFEINRKLKQVDFLFNQLLKYRDKVFVKNGIDEVSGCFPLEVYFAAFIIYSRSILQYALKESKEKSKDKEVLCVNYLKKVPIIELFRNLRDNEIHSFAIMPATTLYVYSPISRNSNAKKKPDKPVKVEHTIRKRIRVDEDLVSRLKAEGNHDLLNSIENGEELFKEIQLNNVKDLFQLSEQYIKAIKEFIEFGKKENFIT